MKKTQESRIEDVLDALTMMHDNENGATITSILETFDVQPRVSTVLQALGIIQVLHGQPVVWLAGKPTEELAKKVYKLANSDKFRNRKRKARKNTEWKEKFDVTAPGLLSSYSTEDLLKEISRRGFTGSLSMKIELK